jgi:hypothetical protein
LQFYAWAEFPQAFKRKARKPHTNSPAQHKVHTSTQ